MEKLHYNITVKGRVQGVWFRKHTKMKADELDIQGFVKNLPNGDVYIEAEGTLLQLNAFIEWLHKGSPHSRVYVVETETDELKGHKYFEIKR
jgi:acylphosphatase